MAQKPRAKPNPKPRAEKPQIERFKEIARQLECDETGDAFERAFAKIAPPKPKPRR